MASTVVTYNGVTIQYVDTGSLVTEAVFDESGSLVIAWRTTAEFNGLVHDTTAVDFVGRVQAVETTLMKSRKTLTVSITEGSSVTLFSVTAAGGGISTSDADNGPRPISANVTQITGGRSAFVQFKISWTVPAVVDPNPQPKILSNRWSQTFEVNLNNYTTRVVEGVLTFSTYATISDLTTIDLYRKFIYPKSIPGFIRNRAQFIITSDNRQLRYVVEDREGYRRFPGPALSGSGRFATRIEGQNLMSAFVITLTGAKNTNPGDLAQAAFNAMRTRINVSQTPAAGGDLIRSIEFEEDLFENTVTLKAQAEAVFGDAGKFFSKTRHFVPLETLPPDQQVLFNQPSPHGSAIIAAAAQAYFDITSNTEANPTSIGDIARAGVINASNPTGAQIGVEALQVQGQGPIDQILNAITITDTQPVISPAQRAASRYAEIQMSFEQSVENNLVVVSAANPSSADEVQQVGKPTVVERYRWMFSRLGKPPVIPDITGKYNAAGGRRGYVRNYKVRTFNPSMQGSTADLAYSTAVEYDLVIPYNTTEFATVSDGGSFVVFTPSVNTPFPASPALGPDSNGQGVTESQPVSPAIRL